MWRLRAETSCGQPYEVGAEIPNRSIIWVPGWCLGSERLGTASSFGQLKGDGVSTLRAAGHAGNRAACGSRSWE